MKFKYLILAAALAASLPAHAALVNDASAIDSANVVDFEAYDGFFPGGPVALAPGLTFTGDEGAQLGANIAELGDNGLWGAGSVFAATGAVAGELRFTFDEGFSSAGAGAFVNLYELGTPSSLLVSAYDINNLLLESHVVSIDTAADSLNDGVFLGIVRSGADIHAISFQGDAAVLDNFAFTTPVPEAETYAMMLAGLGLIGFMARRKSRA